MTDLIWGAALIALAVGMLLGAVPTYNAWQQDVRNLRTALAIERGKREWAERQAQIAQHPSAGGRVVRGPWGGAG